MWAELRGKWAYVTGTNGTPSLPKGAQIIGIHATGAGGSFTINGGSAISIPATSNEFSIRFPHLLVVANTASALVFTSTATYFVEYVDPTSFSYP